MTEAPMEMISYRKSFTLESNGLVLNKVIFYSIASNLGGKPIHCWPNCTHMFNGEKKVGIEYMSGLPRTQYAIRQLNTREDLKQSFIGRLMFQPAVFILILKVRRQNRKIRQGYMYMRNYSSILEILS